MFYNNNQQSKSNIDGWSKQENKNYVLEKQHTNMRQLGKEGIIDKRSRKRWLAKSRSGENEQVCVTIYKQNENRKTYHYW